MCDTVFLFDLPVEVCLKGAISRLDEPRYDVPWVDDELSSGFKREIEEFPNKNLPRIYEILEKYKANKTIVIFKSRAETDEYLANVD